MYSYERLNDNLYKIKDAVGVYMYLVIGTKRCCLIDTGCGFKGLKKFIRTITNLPVFVILTHGHIDHASGCFEFEEVYMSNEDNDVLQHHLSSSFQELFFGKDFDYSILQSQSHQNFLSLEDGQLFDLGKITLEAIHVPGHTKGFMMILIKELRTILFGDGCGPGTILLEEYSANISTYLEALVRIKKRENEYDYILRNHGLGSSSKELLDNVIQVCRDILDYKDAKQPLPREMTYLFENPHGYKMYSGSLITITDNGTERKDGKEGNVSYREDKVK